MSEDALVTREQRGNISVLTMVYRPYNLLGPKLINAIVEQIEAAREPAAAPSSCAAGFGIFRPAPISIFSTSGWSRAVAITRR